MVKVKDPVMYSRCLKLATDIYIQILSNRGATACNPSGIAEIFSLTDMLYSGFETKVNGSKKEPKIKEDENGD